MNKILCICFSPTYQKTVQFDCLNLQQVNRSTNYYLTASGKAVNTARVIEQLGQANISTFCPLGCQNLKEFLKLASKDKLNLKYVSIPGKTRECLTLLENKSNTTTEIVISEPQIFLSYQFLKIQKKILSKILPKLIKANDAVVLAGSRPAFWDSNLYANITKIALDYKKIILSDFAGTDLSNTLKIAIPSIIKINESEYLNSFSLPTNTLEQNLKEHLIIKSTELNNIIIVTRGEKSTFAAQNGILYEIASEKIIPINTTACGDSFNAGFLCEYLQTHNIQTALKKGTWAASKNALSILPGDILHTQN